MLARWVAIVMLMVPTNARNVLITLQLSSREVCPTWLAFVKLGITVLVGKVVRSALMILGRTRMLRRAQLAIGWLNRRPAARIQATVRATLGGQVMVMRSASLAQKTRGHLLAQIRAMSVLTTPKLWSKAPPPPRAYAMPVFSGLDLRSVRHALRGLGPIPGQRMHAFIVLLTQDPLNEATAPRIASALRVFMEMDLRTAHNVLLTRGQLLIRVTLVRPVLIMPYPRPVVRQKPLVRVFPGMSEMVSCRVISVLKIHGHPGTLQNACLVLLMPIRQQEAKARNTVSAMLVLLVKPGNTAKIRMNVTLESTTATFSRVALIRWEASLVPVIPASQVLALAVSLATLARTKQFQETILAPRVL
eukprot:Rmarinus@m.23571